jgi:hypothetical protein
MPVGGMGVTASPALPQAVIRIRTIMQINPIYGIEFTSLVIAKLGDSADSSRCSPLFSFKSMIVSEKEPTRFYAGQYSKSWVMIQTWN